MSINNLTMNSQGGNILLSNSSSIANTNVTNTGGGNVSMYNGGTMDTVNAFTSGANTSLTNFNQIGNLSMTDQNDNTSFLNAFGANVDNAKFTANGALGLINGLNAGTMGNVTLDANYGGQINFDTTFGNMNNVYAEATGSSHGKPSGINFFS